MSTDLTVGQLGLPEHSTSELSADHAARIAATIDATTSVRDGDALPLLWHWAYFTPSVPTADLGTDGHPRLPAGPVSPYPRRMWASGSIEAPGHLVVGVPATRTSRVVGSKESAGRSGALLIVRLEHRYRQEGADRLVEEQTLVYREAGPPLPLPTGEHQASVEGAQWQERHAIDSTTLFRFSAVTFNSHRIHYDQPYAQAIEGYPGLVVHGPLTALLVGESIRNHVGRDLSRFEFRANAPLFAGSEFTIVGTPGQPVTVQVLRNDGVDAMHASATVRE